jgi:hypothetical protein
VRVLLSGIVPQTAVFEDNIDVRTALQLGAEVAPGFPPALADVDLEHVPDRAACEAAALRLAPVMPTHILCVACTAATARAEKYNRWVARVWHAHALRPGAAVDVRRIGFGKSPGAGQGEAFTSSCASLPQPVHVVHVTWLHASNAHWWRCFEAPALLSMSSAFALNRAGGDVRCWGAAADPSQRTAWGRHVGAVLPALPAPLTSNSNSAQAPSPSASGSDAPADAPAGLTLTYSALSALAPCGGYRAAPQDPFARVPEDLWRGRVRHIPRNNFAAPRPLTDGEAGDGQVDGLADEQSLFGARRAWLLSEIVRLGGHEEEEEEDEDDDEELDEEAMRRFDEQLDLHDDDSDAAADSDDAGGPRKRARLAEGAAAGPASEDEESDDGWGDILD